jgi:hypothetical protein
MKRLLFTVLFCLSVYGLVAFIVWDIEWGYTRAINDLNGFDRFCIAIATIILAQVIYPLMEEK